MNIEKRIKQLSSWVPGILQDVGKITGRDVSGVSISLAFGTIKDMRKNEFCRQLEEYNEMDTLVHLKFIDAYARNTSIPVSKHIMHKAMRDLFRTVSERQVSMYYEKNGNIFVTPLGLRLKDDGAKIALAHEITHAIDDAHYNIYDVRKKTLDVLMGEVRGELLRSRKETEYSNAYKMAAMLKSEMITSYLSSLTFTLESHASYVENKYKELKGMPSDAFINSVPFIKMLEMRIMKTLFFSQRRFYDKGVGMIKMAYERGLELEHLLQHLPSVRDVSCPADYFLDIELLRLEGKKGRNYDYFLQPFFKRRI